MTSKRMSPAEALEWLSQGNRKYTSGQVSGWRASAKSLAELTQSGQHPYAVVVSCSDSRCPMEQVFCTRPGEVFAVRTAGHVVGEGALASIEFGVVELKSPLVAVVGHTQCGAVKATLAGQRPPGSISRLIDQIMPAVQQARRLAPQLASSELETLAVEQHVKATIEGLLIKSPVIQQAVRTGVLMLAGGIYDMASGEVRWLDDTSG